VPRRAVCGSANLAPSKAIGAVVMEGLFLANPVSLFALGLVVGIVSGLFGVGGGFLLTPLLHVVFHVPFNLAVGTGITAISVGTVFGAVTHWRQGDVHWPVALTLAIFGVSTVGLGVRAVGYLKHSGVSYGTVSAVDLWLSVAYMAFLIPLGLAILNEARGALRRPPQGGYVRTRFNLTVQRVKIPPTFTLPPPVGQPVSIWPVALVGASGGVLSGFLGIGGGGFIVSALIYLIGLPTHYAAGTNLVALVFIILTGAVHHWAEHNVSIASAVLLALAAALGAIAGARLCRRLRGAQVRQYFGIVVLLVAASVALKLYLAFHGGTP